MALSAKFSNKLDQFKESLKSTYGYSSWKKSILGVAHPAWVDKILLTIEDAKKNNQSTDKECIDKISSLIPEKVKNSQTFNKLVSYKSLMQQGADVIRKRDERETESQLEELKNPIAGQTLHEIKQLVDQAYPRDAYHSSQASAAATRAATEQDLKADATPAAEITQQQKR